MINEKTKSVLAYLFGIIGGLIILMTKNSEQRTKICAAQSITIFIIFYLLKFFSRFTPWNLQYLNYILYGVYFLTIIFGIVKACNNEDPKLPIIGNLSISLFKKQIEKN